MDTQVEAYADHARVVIDRAIDRAVERLEEVIAHKTQKYESMRSELGRQQSLLSRQENYEAGNIPWPTIAQFSVEVGLQKIDEFVHTWERHESWLYCIDFLRSDEHDFDTRYQYRVRWSIPTRRKPIPRATCCVYFTISVSKIKPLRTIVDVYYVVETAQLVHRPGCSRFREKWLKDVIDSKILVMDAIDF